MPLRFRRQVAGDAQNNCQLSSRSVDSIVTSNSAFADPDWDLYESVRDGACSASSVAGPGSSSVGGGGRGQGGSKLALLDIQNSLTSPRLPSSLLSLIPSACLSPPTSLKPSLNDAFSQSN